MKLYHLSEVNLSGKTLYPRIPENFMTKNGFEDTKIARSCFANSVQGALTAISGNIKGKTFIVHEPVTYDVPMIDNSTIVAKNYVPDAHITGETWILVPIKLKAVGIVRVTGAKRQPIEYTYGKHKAETYNWNYTKLPFTLNK